MSIKIALAGNPNCGKTTLFNSLTGSNQFVGNWPGVTVEKKEGKLRKYNDVVITDLPGIYSLSPYTPEEVVTRNYLIGERPDAILNIIDGTNLERNLYLTTQLLEIGIPVVIAVNMMDAVRKNGDKIDTEKLSAHLGCRIVEISALKNEGISEAAEAVVQAARSKEAPPVHKFSESIEQALESIEQTALISFDDSQKRWYGIKLFERDKNVLEQFDTNPSAIEKAIVSVEEEMEDDSESIITNERYEYISSIVDTCYKKKSSGQLSTSDKIDKVVTNRWLGLPIFAIIMFLVYFLSVASNAPGTKLTDWMNDGVFGDGWHLFGIGSSAYSEQADKYGEAATVLDAFEILDAESPEEKYKSISPDSTAEYEIEDEETLATEKVTYSYSDLADAYKVYEDFNGEEPDPANYGVWVPSIPTLAENALTKIGCADWLQGLVIDGIIAGVGAVLGFVPQMLVLFFLLAFLEACGYMARIAFVLDRIFRRLGLSGKSFIPMLIGTGCGVPGIMASRTIENERDRRMTIMTTTFIPCSAKVPFIAMIAGAIFNGSAIVSTSAYFIGMAAIICSGIMLKKTKMFSGDPAPFVMELPAYHMPTLKNLLRSMWERGWSFIKKAGTIILLSTIFVWFTSYFGFTSDGFRMLGEDELNMSILAKIGGVISHIFTPLGWGNWQAAVASITGLVAKENIVGTMGILYGGGDNDVYTSLAGAFTGITAYSFLVFNLLCAPCFAAIGAIKREMNSAKWTIFAVSWQCGFAYCISLMINQFGNALTGKTNIMGLIAALLVLAAMIYMIFIKSGKKEKSR